MAKKFIDFKKQVSEIEDIRKTVKALEKISAANVHYLRITSERMKEYETGIKRIFCHLGEEASGHSLFRKKEGRKRLSVLLTTERGLCGGLLNKLFDFFGKWSQNDDRILLAGEEGKRLLEERGLKVDYFFHLSKDIPQRSDIREIEDLVISRFLKNEFSEVLVFWPAFESLALQNPALFRFLPISEEAFRKEVGGAEAVAGFPIFEPSKKGILDYLIKEYLGLVFYEKVLETKLSELSSRTVAMEEAGEKAKDLIKKLTLKYFREKREQTTKNITDLYGQRMAFSR